MFMGFVIIANAIIIGIETDLGEDVGLEVRGNLYKNTSTVEVFLKCVEVQHTNCVCCFCNSVYFLEKWTKSQPQTTHFVEL